jgi:hypothetical protein
VTLSGPWTRASLVVLVGLDLAVLAALVVAWHQASYLPTPQQQMTWFDLAGVALVVGVSGHTGWLLAGRRAVGRRSRSVAERALALPVNERPTDQVLTGSGMTLFHRPGCPLSAARPTEALAAADAAGRGLRPCAVCRPEAR